MIKSVGGFHAGRYKRTVAEIRSLRSKLPESSVISLAREVLLRVAVHAAPKEDNPVADEDLETLARTLIATDPDAGSDFVDDLRRRGVTVESVYLNYLAHAARKLGTWWEDDTISLLDVTVGTGRIYAIMRAMADLFDAPVRADAKTAVLAAVPGETHLIGVRMAADLLRKKGWAIDLKIGRDHDELVQEIGNSNHVLIGLSAGGEHTITALSRLIVALRISNPRTKIIVSGNVIAEASNVVGLMGVDAMPADFHEAAAIMETMWDDMHPDLRSSF